MKSLEKLVEYSNTHEIMKSLKACNMKNYSGALGSSQHAILSFLPLRLNLSESAARTWS
jgi:hypothetical protein